jgi:hypothetical protein
MPMVKSSVCPIAKGSPRGNSYIKQELSCFSKRLLLALLVVTCVGEVAKAGFNEVGTAFGPQTGLEDVSTGLVWLDLSITSGQSFDSVLANTAAGGTYSGWQFASPGQLTTLFVDYTRGNTFAEYAGAPASDSTLAIAFMNALGGPLYTVTNPANGFSRMSSNGFLNIPFGLGAAQYGYIAVDNFFGPSIDPSLQGSAVEDLGSNGIGSWLVESASTPEPCSLSLVGLGAAALIIAKCYRGMLGRTSR